MPFNFVKSILDFRAISLKNLSLIMILKLMKMNVTLRNEIVQGVDLDLSHGSEAGGPETRS